MTRFPLNPAPLQTNELKQNVSLSSMRSVILSTAQLNSTSPIKINNVHYLIDPKAKLKLSPTSITAVNIGQSSDKSQLQVLQVHEKRTSPLPIQMMHLKSIALTSSSSDSRIILGLGMLKGCCLYFQGQKYIIETKIFKEQQVLVQASQNFKNLILTDVSLMQTVPLLISDKNQTINVNKTEPYSSYLSLINTLLKRIQNKKVMTKNHTKLNNHLAKKIQQLGGGVAEHIAHSEKQTSKTTLFESLNISNLKSLASADLIKHELLLSFQYQPSQLNVSAQPSFFEAIKSLWQILLLKQYSSDTRTDMIQTLQQQIKQSQLLELARLLKADDFNAVNDLNSLIALYQSASTHNDDSTSLYFGLPYYQKDQLEFLEGHFEKQSKVDDGKNNFNWQLQLRFNLKLGGLLLKVSCKNHNELTIRIISKHSALLERLRLLIVAFEHKLIASDFYISSLAIVEDNIPHTLINSNNQLVKAKA